MRARVYVCDNVDRFYEDKSGFGWLFEVITLLRVTKPNIRINFILYVND